MIITDLKQQFSPKGFEKLSVYVKHNFGINLTNEKKHLVANRLSSRVQLHKLDSYDDYFDYLFSPEGFNEKDLICDFLSTNKTYFNRESVHFDFLKKILKTHDSDKQLSIWSAGCSAGDEAYTLSILLNEHLLANPINLNYEIIGTDISSRMLTEAIKGEYSSERVNQLPSLLINKYFRKSVDNNRELYNINASARKKVSFRKFNLIKDFPRLTQKYDVIFCRNVMIYFDEITKNQVANNLINCLKPGGHLILGHCEGMICRNSPLYYVQPSVYKKPE